MDLRSEIKKSSILSIELFFIKKLSVEDYFTPLISFFTIGDKAIKTIPAINE